MSVQLLRLPAMGHTNGIQRVFRRQVAYLLDERLSLTLHLRRKLKPKPGSHSHYLFHGTSASLVWSKDVGFGLNYHTIMFAYRRCFSCHAL